MKKCNHHINWAQAASELSSLGQPYVLVTMLNIHGSSPRENGTKMLVTADKTVESIGGGHLEFLAIKKSRALLLENNCQQLIEDFSLGATLGQCCGGKVTLLFESFIPAKVQIALFGAGHVSRSLISILSGLPVNVIWIDSRENEFPQEIPNNVSRVISEYPEDEVIDLPANTYAIVMTHSHALDYTIVSKLLKEKNYQFLGLIGSNTKSKRFRKRLERRGFEKSSIDSLKCPIGLSSIPGKKPMEIAVSIAAEVISQYQSEQTITSIEATDFNLFSTV